MVDPMVDHALQGGGRGVVRGCGAENDGEKFCSTADSAADVCFCVECLIDASVLSYYSTRISLLYTPGPLFQNIHAGSKLNNPAVEYSVAMLPWVLVPTFRPAPCGYGYMHQAQ